MSTVTIGGVEVDTSDPCATLEALRPAYYRLVAGEAEVEVRFRERSVRLAVMATNMTELGKLIQDLEAKCLATKGKRRRFAKGIRFH